MATATIEKVKPGAACMSKFCKCYQRTCPAPESRQVYLQSYAGSREKVPFSGDTPVLAIDLLLTCWIYLHTAVVTMQHHVYVGCSWRSAGAVFDRLLGFEDGRWSRSGPRLVQLSSTDTKTHQRDSGLEAAMCTSLRLSSSRNALVCSSSWLQTTSWGSPSHRGGAPRLAAKFALSWRRSPICQWKSVGAFTAFANYGCPCRRTGAGAITEHRSREERPVRVVCALLHSLIHTSSLGLQRTNSSSAGWDQSMERQSESRTWTACCQWA